MRKRKQINDEELLELRTRGWSTQRLALRLGVSKATIKRRLREIRKSESDAAVIEFAARIEQMAKLAPTFSVKKELLRCVNILRTRHAASRTRRAELIIEVLRRAPDAPVEAGEVARETRLPLELVLETLEILAGEGKLERISVPGLGNATRRKFYRIVF